MKYDDLFEKRPVRLKRVSLKNAPVLRMESWLLAGGGLLEDLGAPLKLPKDERRSTY